MTVVAHFTGKTSGDAIAPIRAAFTGLQGLLAAEPGYERAELLVNHRELSVQFLIYWRDFETCQDFLKRHSSSLVATFADLVHDANPPYVFALEGELVAG